jgi:hypothetical protein
MSAVQAYSVAAALVFLAASLYGLSNQGFAAHAWIEAFLGAFSITYYVLARAVGCHMLAKIFTEPEKDKCESPLQTRSFPDCEESDIPPLCFHAVRSVSSRDPFPAS